MYALAENIEMNRMKMINTVCSLKKPLRAIENIHVNDSYKNSVSTILAIISRGTDFANID